MKESSCPWCVVVLVYINSVKEQKTWSLILVSCVVYLLYPSRQGQYAGFDLKWTFEFFYFFYFSIWCSHEWCCSERLLLLFDVFWAWQLWNYGTNLFWKCHKICDCPELWNYKTNFFGWNNNNDNNINSECFSMWNMLKCAEQVQLEKYKTHEYKTPKTACVQTIMFKHAVRFVIVLSCEIIEQICVGNVVRSVTVFLKQL